MERNNRCDGKQRERLGRKNEVESGRGGGGRGGRDRFRRDYPSRYEDNKGSGVSGRDNRSNNPPSRHLWVGNLSHNIVEEELVHHFLRFGSLANVAFQPGRSYAFINFRRDEDAIDAMRALQGFPLAGNPLRIEFAKAACALSKFQSSMGSYESGCERFRTWMANLRRSEIPVQFLSDEDHDPGLENPAYQAWEPPDQLLLTWLQLSFNVSILALKLNTSEIKTNMAKAKPISSPMAERAWQWRSGGVGHGGWYPFDTMLRGKGETI
ncbi:Flowering time control protein FPA, partial [Mucuna pruriens]